MVIFKRKCVDCGNKTKTKDDEDGQFRCMFCQIAPYIRNIRIAAKLGAIRRW